MPRIGRVRHCGPVLASHLARKIAFSRENNVLPVQSPRTDLGHQHGEAALVERKAPPERGHDSGSPRPHIVKWGDDGASTLERQKHSTQARGRAMYESLITRHCSAAKISTPLSTPSPIGCKSWDQRMLALDSVTG